MSIDKQSRRTNASKVKFKMSSIKPVAVDVTAPKSMGVPTTSVLRDLIFKPFITEGSVKLLEILQAHQKPLFKSLCYRFHLSLTLAIMCV